MTQTLNLEKTLDLRKTMVLDLSKKIGLRNQKSAVVLALDYSGSMRQLYKDGTVQELVERILPLGLAFDDNGEVDFYLFHEGFIKLPENITLKNIAGYISNKVINKYTMGSTNYAPVINDIVSRFKPGKTLMGLGSPKKLDYPVYVLYITDGINDDKRATEKALIDASSYGIFFQFIGIGEEKFPFLEKLDDLSGRKIDNANFCIIKSPKDKTDEELYSLLLKEYPSFVMEARTQGLIV